MIEHFWIVYLDVFISHSHFRTPRCWELVWVDAGLVSSRQVCFIRRLLAFLSGIGRCFAG